MSQNLNTDNSLNCKEVLFKTLNELIKHHDEQLTKYHKFYLTALGSLIPLAVFFDKFKLHWSATIGVFFLAIALATSWILNSKKISLEKYCCINSIRKVEEKYFFSEHGPYTAQRIFFEDLKAQNVTFFDRLLLGKKRLRRLRLIPYSTLVLAIFFSLFALFSKIWNI